LLSDEGLSNILSVCPVLRNLSLLECRNIKGNAFKDHNLLHLQVLNLHEHTMSTPI
jgi:hypothetical protein